MNLSSELISQFVKITKNDEKPDNGSTVYGTIVEYEGQRCVKLDGSDQITPITSTADVLPGDRVAVLIKNHTATVTGNVTSPSARKETVDGLGEDVKEHGDKIAEFDNIVADMVTTEQLTAVQANIELLLADKAYIKDLEAVEAEIERLDAEKATIEQLEVVDGKFETLDAKYLSADAADIKYATIESLEATTAKFNSLEAAFGEFEDLSTTKLEAIDADIKRLDAEKVSADELDTKYANIDFGNIGEAAIRKLFSDTGLIKDLVVSSGTITGELVGVTIKGDIIEGGTVKADKLVVKGSDGLYYKLNFEGGNFAEGEVIPDDGLHGSVIVAQSITAEKIAVDDLVAFDATIGGFEITGADNETGAYASIHSFAKTSADSSVEGIYLGSDGQMAIGDGNRFLRYFKDSEGKYKLEIAADSISFNTSNIRVGARNLIRNSTDLVFDGYYFLDPNAFVLGVSQLGMFALTRDANNNDPETDYLNEPDTSVAAVAVTPDQYTPQGFKDGMTLHDYHLINMENAIISALGGVPVSRITTVHLLANEWTGSGTIYSQAVTMSGVTANSKIDLLPSPEQLNDLLLAEISLTAANSDGVITVFAIGDAPSMDLELQAMITEVVVPEVNV